MFHALQTARINDALASLEAGNEDLAHRLLTVVANRYRRAAAARAN